MPFTDSISMVDVVITTKTQLTATPNDVVAGKQFIGTTQHLESGTLQTNPVHSDVTIVAGESYNIPNGINPVSYNVIAKGLSDETPGTATASNILMNETAWVNGEKITGVMPNIGKEEDELLCGETHQISTGYHDGTGFVKAKNLFDQTKASIAAEDLRTGSDCWANGEHIYGNMTDNGKVSATLTAGESYIVPEGFHNGEGKITAKTLASQTPGNATGGELVEGRTAWVNGVQIVGTITSNPAEEIILPLNGSYNIPNGYHTGLGMITQNIPSKEGQMIAPTKDPQTIPLAGYYMEGDITVAGVSGLNYQKSTNAVKDSAGTNISNYPMTVTSGQCKIYLYMDNWHDNSTYNVYKLTFSNLIDANDNPVSIDCDLFFDYMIGATMSFGNIVIEMGIEDGAQYIKITGIKSGNLTMLDHMDAREFG